MIAPFSRRDLSAIIVRTRNNGIKQSEFLESSESEPGKGSLRADFIVKRLRNLAGYCASGLCIDYKGRIYSIRADAEVLLVSAYNIALRFFYSATALIGGGAAMLRAELCLSKGGKSLPFS